MRLMILALGLLAGCATYEPVTTTQNDIEVRDEALSTYLRDFETARFADEVEVEQNQSNGLRRVCGKVNATNGFGGFTGFEPYSVIYDPTTNDVVLVGPLCA